jgi:glycosyltransferase involved in cell wall biosynthesis
MSTREITTMLFSILIPTLEGRRERFDLLYQKLSKQIAENSLSGEVEVAYFLDNMEHSVGFKRNKLIERAKGKFVAFVDDDDDISDDYVHLICNAIKKNPDIDCIGIKGIITFRGKDPRIFVHSLQYKQYFSRGSMYFRPPYHLNPVKREIATKYMFEDISYSEDIDWAMRICRAGALKKEFFIDTVIYFYNSRRSQYYQSLLDLSEPFRHALGLQLANWVRMKRSMKSLLGRQV